jgi:hypothetical protein
MAIARLTRATESRPNATIWTVADFDDEIVLRASHPVASPKANAIAVIISFDRLDAAYAAYARARDAKQSKLRA